MTADTLAGKMTFVTGASLGIGSCECGHFANAGSIIMTTDLELSTLLQILLKNFSGLSQFKPLVMC